jgi:hypothetical protein
MTDANLARQIAANPDAAPDMAPEIDVRAIRRAGGMTQVSGDAHSFHPLTSAPTPPAPH